MRIFTTLFIFCIVTTAQAQSPKMSVVKGLQLTADSTINQALLRDVQAFLTAAELPNEQNIYVLPSQKIETYILLDEILGITKHTITKEVNYYKPIISNCIPLEENQYLLQISYLGGDDVDAQLNAVFEIIAHADKGNFLFSSPLKYNTATWKMYANKSTTIFFKSDIQVNRVEEYTAFAAQMDAKLKSTDKRTEFYCCDNFVEVLKLIGVLYKADYAGIQLNTLSSLVENKKLIVMGENSSHFNDFDKHDLWHDRLSLVVPRSAVHKPLDEGCAYLYGGSWGMSWEDIFSKFIATVPMNEKTDWQAYKETPFDFGDSDATHLYVDYVVNALIAQYLEEKYGFDAVFTLLKSGKFQKGNENYYTTLTALTGISKTDYNKWVYELINAAK